jgi:hypothetical protein
MFDAAYLSRLQIWGGKVRHSVRFERSPAARPGLVGGCCQPFLPSWEVCLKHHQSNQRRLVMRNQNLEVVKRIGTGLAFILYPLFSGLAFAAHPNLLSLEVSREASAKVAEFHNNPLCTLDTL